MKKLLLFGLLILMGCDQPIENKEKEKYIEKNTFNIKVQDIKDIVQGDTHYYYIIDKEKNSYPIYTSDFVRLDVGDSIKIFYTRYGYVEIKEIYLNK